MPTHWTTKLVAALVRSITNTLVLVTLRRCGVVNQVFLELLNFSLKTKDNPRLTTESYTRENVDVSVCGERVERVTKRWDDSYYSVYRQQRFCSYHDLVYEFANINKNCERGWVTYDGSMKVVSCKRNNHYTVRGDIQIELDGEYPIYCCDRDYRMTGESCRYDSDCGSWICNGICQRYYYVHLHTYLYLITQHIHCKNEQKAKS